MVEADQIEAAAAEVAQNAVRGGDAVEQADGRQARFLGAAEDVHRQPARRFHRIGEGGAVAGVADGGGGDQFQVLDPHRRRQAGEPVGRLQGEGDALGIEPAGLAEAGAQRALRLLIEDGNGNPGRNVIDDEADGVGADVDDPDPAGCRLGVAGETPTGASLSPRRRNRGGGALLPLAWLVPETGDDLAAGRGIPMPADRPLAALNPVADKATIV